ISHHRPHRFGVFAPIAEPVRTILAAEGIAGERSEIRCRRGVEPARQIRVDLHRLWLPGRPMPIGCLSTPLRSWDVLVMEGEDRCAAYRAPAWPDQNPISVQSVRWCYMGAISAVLPNC